MTTTFCRTLKVPTYQGVSEFAGIIPIKILMELLELYKTNITKTSNGITGVGMAMVRMKDYLCYMNVSSIEQ